MPSEEALGWMAAIASMLAFGSFGVPIKSDAANSVDVDPLVFQSYKSFMCFATSWIVLLVGVPFTYTPWGIVSCLFWVPGGVATVFAIRNAGLAIAIGIGSSSIVLVSFIWGIFVFQEDIHSQLGASVAVAFMMTGIFGMSYYSAPRIASSGAQHPLQEQQLVSTHSAQFVSMSDPGSPQSTRRHPRGYEGVEANHFDSPLEVQQSSRVDTITIPEEQGATAMNHTIDTTSVEQFQEDYCSNTTTPAINNNGHHDPLEIIHVLGMPFTRRQLGIAGATFNGLWGGSIMAPMKFCHDSTSGVGYLISFGIGAAIVTTALWIVRYIHNVVHYGCAKQAYQALPSFHFKVMWRAGGTSGLLWSIGNFFSLLSVYYLGEGVGYSVVQAGMLVSGLWGIFYFHEIQGLETIAKWLAAASVTVFGIILLSYEHHKA